MKIQWIICSTIAMIFAPNPYGYSQIVPDASFGSGGVVITDIGGINDGASKVALQSDGKIVVGGFNNNGFPACDFSIVRYNTDGTLDTSFGTNGIVVTDIGGNMDYGGSVTIQSDGKIVLVGKSIDTSSQCKVAVLRYNQDGSLDNSFSVDGITLTDLGGVYYDYYSSDGANQAILQSDGKILVIGNRFADPYFEIALLRFNSDGSLDASFDSDGIVISSIIGNAVAGSGAIQIDGKILVGGSIGSGFGVVRYHSNGSLDNSFDGDGWVSTPIFSSASGMKILIQADGKLVLAGFVNAGIAGIDFVVVRYNTDGSLDNSFDGDGKAITDFGAGSLDFGLDAIIMSNGNILVSGPSNSDVAMVCYQPNGSLDLTFDTDGKYAQAFNGGLSQAYSIAIQTDEKIVLAGYTADINNVPIDFMVLRFGNTPTGIEPTLGNLSNGVVFPNPTDGMIGFYAEEDLMNASLRITNLAGETIYCKENMNGRSFVFDISDKPAGIYFMTITSGTSHQTWKIIRQDSR